MPVDDRDAVRAAVDRARQAQRGWAETDFARRRRVLRRITDEVLIRTDELVDMICRDSGKTREQALMGEVWPVCEKLRWTAKHAAVHLRPERVSPGLMPHKRARIEFHPLGVMGAIVSWNYPLQNLMNPIIPALAAGNGIVVKPSEWVAWSATLFVGIVKRALEAEYQDSELVQVIQGYAETGQALVEAGVDGLLFIGSVGNGRRVLAAAAKTVTPVILEAGGNDPLVVCDDAHLEQAAHAAMVGCFFSAGQNCVASERLLVFDECYAEFEHLVTDLVLRLRQGPPAKDGAIDVGALVTPLQLDKVEGLVSKAIEQGARLVVGGQRVLSEQGNYYAPTVLADVTEDMDIMREETFGPVMVLCRVQDEHDAVRIANGTGFGLSSSVFSKDRRKARRIAHRLHAGMTAINEFGGATYMAQDLPFGGVKQSGFGRMNGRDGLRACCNAKAVLDDRLPLFLPNKVFPVGPMSFGRLHAALRLIYGRGVGYRLRALLRLALSFVRRA